MVSVPHGPSALSGPSMNGTFPFSNNHMRPSVREHNMYNSSATLLPSSYQQQYHYHQPRRTDLEMNSDPSDTRSFRSMHRSVSVQEGSDSQQTRRHIFNNLSNIFGMDLVQYVMTLHPQEVNVEKLMFLLNKEQMTRLGNGSMRLWMEYGHIQLFLAYWNPLMYTSRFVFRNSSTGNETEYRRLLHR